MGQCILSCDMTGGDIIETYISSLPIRGVTFLQLFEKYIQNGINFDKLVAEMLTPQNLQNENQKQAAAGIWTTFYNDTSQMKNIVLYFTLYLLCGNQDAGMDKMETLFVGDQEVAKKDAKNIASQHFQFVCAEYFQIYQILLDYLHVFYPNNVQDIKRYKERIYYREQNYRLGWIQKCIVPFKENPFCNTQNVLHVYTNQLRNGRALRDSFEKYMTDLRRGSQAQPRPQVQSRPQPQPEPQVQFQPDPQPQPQPQPQPEPEPQQEMVRPRPRKIQAEGAGVDANIQRFGGNEGADYL